MSIDQIDPVLNLNRPLGEFQPEPETSARIDFTGLLKMAGGLVNTATGGEVPGLDAPYQELINKQIEVQQQMMLMSMSSNIEKSRHETQMAAVRNIRTS